MVEPKTRVVLDTNILISAFVFGGKPRQVLGLVLKKKIQAVISPFLLSELFEILSKKFFFPDAFIEIIKRRLAKNFITVFPKSSVFLLKSADDRVIEAALEGGCQFIVTGDKELLQLGFYRRIKIVSAADFLSGMAGR